MIVVLLATDNHFLADAIGALLVVGVAVEAARLWALVNTRGWPLVAKGGPAPTQRMLKPVARSGAIDRSEDVVDQP